jgi:hypothetical protein
MWDAEGGPGNGTALRFSVASARVVLVLSADQVSTWCQGVCGCLKTNFVANSKDSQESLSAETACNQGVSVSSIRELPEDLEAMFDGLRLRCSIAGASG